MSTKRNPRRREFGYNGWANYPTWYIALDLPTLLADMAVDQGEVGDIDGDYCKEYAYSVFYEEVSDDFAQEAVDYFLSEVDWREIAEATKEIAMQSV